MNIAALDLALPDPDSPIPLYYQVESDLRRLIDDGVLEPGAVIPPEVELSRAYGVSRQTVRQALARLAADDLIWRGAGRGTFVNPPSVPPFCLDRSFTRQMADMGRTARSRVLDLTRGTVDGKAIPALRSHTGAPCLHLVRLRLGDDEPIGLQHATILTSRCPDLHRHDFTARSLYDVLSTDYALAITEIHHTISAVVSDGRQASLLEVPPGTPLLLVRTTSFLADASLIEVTSSVYRSDRYVYSTTHVFDAGS